MDEGDDHHHHQTLENGGGGGTSIHITALDGVVNVNSLFTLAAFVGLAWNPSAGATPGAAPCDVDFGKLETDLVSFHVLAFACFLFSSLVALCLKQAIRAHHPTSTPAAAAATRAPRGSTARRCAAASSRAPRARCSGAASSCWRSSTSSRSSSAGSAAASPPSPPSPRSSPSSPPPCSSTPPSSSTPSLADPPTSFTLQIPNIYLDAFITVLSISTL
uniref:Uncharacterized protein n=1 Tax=Ananas comosus var. bracteatus TaxID=296719 RepID=A0A6V7NGX5_ANACO|nr:unnamed protein product [Ananas comosus var. bracteatus]